MNIYELRRGIRKIVLLEKGIELYRCQRENLEKEIKDSSDEDLIKKNNVKIQMLSCWETELIYKQNELGKKISQMAKDLPITLESILDIMSITEIDVDIDDSGLIRNDVIKSRLKLKSKIVTIKLKDSNNDEIYGYILDIDRDGIHLNQIVGESVEYKFINSFEIKSIRLKDDYRDSFSKRNNKSLFEYDMVEAGRYDRCEIVGSDLEVYFEFKTLVIHCCEDYCGEPSLEIESIELESSLEKYLEDKYLVSIDVSTFECRLVFSDESELVYSMEFEEDCGSDGSYAGLSFNQILKIKNN